MMMTNPAVITIYIYIYSQVEMKYLMCNRCYTLLVDEWSRDEAAFYIFAMVHFKQSISLNRVLTVMI